MNLNMIVGQWAVKSFDIRGSRTQCEKWVAFNVSGDKVIKQKYFFNGKWNISTDLMMIEDGDGFKLLEDNRWCWSVQSVTTDELVIINNLKNLVYNFKRL